MSSELGQQEGQELQTPPANDSQVWGQERSTEGPWRTSQRRPSPDPDAFPVEWQLSREEDDAPIEHHVSRDEEARMLQRRLLRLYRVYYPPPDSR
jgi:hypothetical protein